MNFWDYLLIAALLVLCFFAWRAVRKHGLNHCGGDCQHCAFGDQCRKKGKKSGPPKKRR